MMGNIDFRVDSFVGLTIEAMYALLNQRCTYSKLKQSCTFKLYLHYLILHLLYLVLFVYSVFLSTALKIRPSNCVSKNDTGTLDF